MDEIVIATGSDQSVFEPAVSCMAAQAAYVVAWADRAAGTIVAQRFSTSGQRAEPRIVVATADGPNTEVVHPAVGPRGPGFVVAWIERAVNPPGPATRVLAQVYNIEGHPRGERVVVSDVDVDATYPPQLALMGDGGFLVVWLALSRTDRVRAARFSPEGLPAAAAFTVNTTDGLHRRPMVTRLQDFSYVVGWELDSAIGDGALRLRIFNFAGDPLSAEIAADADGGEAAIDFVAGGFVVAWIKPGLEDGIGVRMSSVTSSLFTLDGQLVAPFVASTGDHRNSGWPAVASGFASGRAVVAWVEKRSDTFETTPVVMATVMSDQGHVGADPVRPISGASAARRTSVAAAGAIDEGGETTMIVWVEDDASGSVLRGRVVSVTAGGIA